MTRAIGALLMILLILRTAMAREMRILPMCFIYLENYYDQNIRTLPTIKFTQINRRAEHY